MLALLLLAHTALADPFFAWGDHTAAGTVAANPYLLAWPDGTFGARGYGAVGLTDRWDVVAGVGSYGLGEPWSETGFFDLMPRWAVSDSGETVIAMRLGFEGVLGFGPELHTVQRPNDRWAAWLNLSASFAPTDMSYAYVGLVLGVDFAVNDTWFVALESDNFLAMLAPRHEHELDITPSFGAWFTESTGASLGLIVPIGRDEPVAAGAWLWTERPRREK